ncbi:two-component system nitrogen regulation sensor histidine kinase NtrY [Bradyrhizobium sp. LM3.4]
MWYEYISIRPRRIPFSAPIAGMTSAETSAASFDTAPAEEPRRWSARRWLAPFAVALALLSAFLTFMVLTGLTSIEPTPAVVRSFYLINAGTILLLVGIIIRELWQLILARRRGRAAARLHVQIVSLFSIVAVLPAVLVAVVANVTIERGLDRLFSGPTKEVIQNSLTIARAYMQDHAQLIRGDILGMANDIAHARPLYDQDRRSFRELLTSSAASRNLPGAMIIDKNTNILESADTGMRLAYSPPAPDFLSNVNESEPEIAVLPDASFVAAVVRLRAFSDTFLYVARPLDPNVVNQLKQTELSVAEYAQIESRRLGIQVAFALMFAVIALTILMASVIIGLNFANSLVSPIRRLMNAAQTVSTGDLHVKVPVHQSEGDLAQLGETFNKMTQELRSQRDELVNASDLIDSRRRFIEAVLSSASAGIIGVDTSGSVGILNRSAEKLIGHSEAETLGHPLSDVLPELEEMMKTAREGTQRLVQGQITITRDGQERNLSVRVSAEKTSQPHDSYIITLDDITDLVSAQRTSAWGDVARRIAHEIKNPLTPIQLSAERIRRKFGKDITEGKDKQIFEQCTDTIVRQVDDIRRMVDEFSRFARMPKPVMEGEDVVDTVRQAVFLMKVAHPGDRYRGRVQGRPAARPVRPAADLAGGHQHRQERHRGDRAGPPGGARQRPDRRRGVARGRGRADRRRRQRHRPAQGGALAPPRAVCDDTRQGHRPWARDRRPRAGRPWRAHRTEGRLRLPRGPARRLDADAFCGLRHSREKRGGRTGDRGNDQAGHQGNGHGIRQGYGNKRAGH